MVSMISLLNRLLFIVGVRKLEKSHCGTNGESKCVFGDKRIFENLSGRYYFEGDIIEFLITLL